MNNPIKFKVTGILESFEGKAAWVFLPVDLLDVPPVLPGGWGSVPIKVSLGTTTWVTSMFPLKNRGYFIPIKKAVLKAESLSIGDTVTVHYHSV